MAGLAPTGEEAHGVVPDDLQSVSRAPQPSPQPGLDGRDWIVLLEVDAYRKSGP